MEVANNRKPQRRRRQVGRSFEMAKETEGKDEDD